MKNFIAKFWAILSIFLLLGSFMFGQQLQDILMKAPFMRIDPSFSGGEVESSVNQGAYTINIHQKVFPALIGEGSEGFRQITVIKNDSAVNNYNIKTFAVDSLTTIKIVDNVPEVTKGVSSFTINEVGLSDKKMIFRIKEKR
ncbi:MAG: hypothetical protein J6Z01_12025 [Bacteroidales bacterium]|nr:hypothetical protein [Bacteroidales bacterium]